MICNKQKFRGRSAAIGILLAGMAIGYIVGLWQQAAQKAHRMNCETCRTEIGK